MSLSSIGSHLMVSAEFLAHWQSVNLELGETPSTELTLEGNYSRADMVADQAALQAAITDLEAKENDRQIVARNRDIQKEELLGHLHSFRGMLRGKLPGSTYSAAASKLPARTSSESKFLGPLEDTASLWAKINADTSTPGFTPPLLLAGGLDLATYLADLADLRAMYRAVTTAEHELRVARKQRDAMLPKVRARMLQYRSLVQATFGARHPLAQSLPRYSRPGQRV